MLNLGWFNLALKAINNGTFTGVEHSRQAKLFSLNGKSMVAIIESNAALSMKLFERAISDLNERQLQIKFYFLRGIIFSNLNKWDLAYESFQKLLSIKQSHFFKKLFLKSLGHLQTERPALMNNRGPLARTDALSFDTKIKIEKGITQISSSLGDGIFFYRKLYEKYLIENRHSDSRIQEEYDKRFGLVISRNV